MNYPGCDRIELPSSELKNKAISILLSYKYEKLNGLSCAEYINKPIKKDPSRKGRQKGVKNKANR